MAYSIGSLRAARWCWVWWNSAFCGCLCPSLSCPATSCRQVRNLRTLCDSKGKSVGILLLEYSDIQSVRGATEADGICRMRMLQGFGIVPRAMLVSAFAAFIRRWPHLTRQHRNQSLIFAASHFLEGHNNQIPRCPRLRAARSAVPPGRRQPGTLARWGWLRGGATAEADGCARAAQGAKGMVSFMAYHGLSYCLILSIVDFIWLYSDYVFFLVVVVYYYDYVISHHHHHHHHHYCCWFLSWEFTCFH